MWSLESKKDPHIATPITEGLPRSYPNHSRGTHIVIQTTEGTPIWLVKSQKDHPMSYSNHRMIPYMVMQITASGHHKVIPITEGAPITLFKSQPVLPLRNSSGAKHSPLGSPVPAEAPATIRAIWGFQKFWRVCVFEPCLCNLNHHNHHHIWYAYL